MIPENHKTEVPLAHYRERFAAMDPAEACARTGLSFTDGAFRLSFLGRKVCVAWPSGDADLSASAAPLAPYTHILLLRLLTEGSLVPAAGRMLAYRELPWGPTYVTQFDGRCTRRLAAVYGSRFDAFRDACLALTGTPAPGGDLAFDLPLLPGYTVRLTLWAPDDEFPATASFLFSDNFPVSFTAEDCAVIGDIILRALSGRF